MTQKNEARSQSIDFTFLSKRILQGAGIALILITIFLLQAGNLIRNGESSG